MNDRKLPTPGERVQRFIERILLTVLALLCITMAGAFLWEAFTDPHFVIGPFL